MQALHRADKASAKYFTTEDLRIKREASQEHDAQKEDGPVERRVLHEDISLNGWRERIRRFRGEIG
jgi:hypothetical protein